MKTTRYDMDAALRNRISAMNREDQAGILWRMIGAMEMKVEFGHPGAEDFFTTLEMTMNHMTREVTK